MLTKLNNTKLVWKNKTFSLSDLLLCIFFILMCDFVGYLSSFTQEASLKAWYPLLNKSKLTPPGFVFVIVWSILYTLIGISTFLAFKNAKKEGKVYVLFIFFIQLCFNFLWSVFFFGMRAPLLAFVEILFYIIVILSMMKIYKSINKIAYFMLIPYLIWVIFATYLTSVVLLLN